MQEGPHQEKRPGAGHRRQGQGRARPGPARAAAVAERAIVERVNLIKRHTRPNPQKGVQGGILDREAPIHVSNLMVICTECGKPARMGHKRLADGRGERVCKRCGATVGKRT